MRCCLVRAGAWQEVSHGQSLNPLRILLLCVDNELNIENSQSVQSEDCTSVCVCVGGLCQSGVSRTLRRQRSVSLASAHPGRGESRRGRKYPLGRYPVSLRDKIHFSSRLLAGVPRRMLTAPSTSAHRLKRLASLAWFGSAAVFSLPIWRSLTSFGTRLESHRVAGPIGFIWVTVPSSAGWWAARRQWNPCLSTRRQCSAGSVHVP